MNAIHGVTLERYADLGAEIAGYENDPEGQKRIVATKGIDPNLWPAIIAGWTDRMRDVSDMGQTATRYMGLYQAALAAKKGVADVSFDDFVVLSGAAKAWGIERMFATYGIDMATWTQLAGTWNGQRIPQSPQAYSGFGLAVEQEAARLAQGGPQRPVSILRQAGVAPQQVLGSGASPGRDKQMAPQAPAMGGFGGAQAVGGSGAAGTPLSIENQMARNMAQANVANAMASAQGQAAAAYSQASNNLGFMGRFWARLFGYGSIADGIGPGMQAWVTLNGQKTPCMVGQIGNGSAAVTLATGQQVTVPMSSLSKS